MRDTNERMAAVKARVAELEAKRRRRSRGLAVLSVAACLLLVIGLSFAMPRWTAQMSGAPQSGGSTAASLFSGQDALGYLFIAILAFILGAAVTLLCVLLRKPTHHEDGLP